MKQKSKGSAIGISLILVVFILLCLITFGTLSYLQARADNALSVSAAENTLAFYQADFTAQTTLAQIDASLANAYVASDSAEAYASALQSMFQADDAVQVVQGIDGITVTFTTTVSEKEALVGTLAVLYPAGETYYTITSWVLVPIT